MPVIGDVSVDLSDGTAAVHSAPGVDHMIMNLALNMIWKSIHRYLPMVNIRMRLNQKNLVGMSVTDAQGWVINDLTENGFLIYKTSIKHSYPHCWRCHGGLIFRATKQWFFDLERVV